MVANDDHDRHGSRSPNDNRAELSNLVRAWRKRLRVTDIPGLPTYPPRRSDYVSQDDVARLVGSTSYWYGELERGVQGRYSDDFLDRVTTVLRLSDAERVALFHLAVRREPPVHHVPSTEVSPTVQAVIDALPVPAYVSDIAWDVLYRNQHLDRWFPWLPREPNEMRWVLVAPEARTQLADWATDWAPPAVAQLRLGHARFPDNQRLTRLIREILQVCPMARHLWQENPSVKLHPDGDIRKIYVPAQLDPVTIEIVAHSPLRDPTQRFIVLMPLDTAAGPGVTPA